MKNIDSLQVSVEAPQGNSGGKLSSLKEKTMFHRFLLQNDESIYSVSQVS